MCLCVGQRALVAKLSVALSVSESVECFFSPVSHICILTRAIDRQIKGHLHQLTDSIKSILMDNEAGTVKSRNTGIYFEKIIKTQHHVSPTGSYRILAESSADEEM